MFSGNCLGCCYTMGEPFTIQISSKLINQLADGGEKLKKKTKKPRQKLPGGRLQSQTKVPEKQVFDDSETRKGTAAAGWPPQSLLYMPVSTPQPAIRELDAIRSVLQDSERVLERLKTQEEHMVQEVTQRAKDLHDKEFKLPYQKPIPCLAERDACLECYKENVNDALKCANVVRSFADCARRARQQVN